MLRLDDLPGADFDGIAVDLALYGIDPADARFEPVELAVTELAGWVCPPSSYLDDGDVDGFERADRFAELYAAGQGGQIPPIVVAHLDGAWQVFDGLHRLSGASAAGASTIACYQLRR